MSVDRQFVVAGIGIWITFIAVQLGGLLLARPLIAEDVDMGADPADPRIGVFFVVALLLATAMLLAAFRFGLHGIVRGFIYLVAIGITWWVLSVLLPSAIVVAGINPMPPILAVVLGLAVAYHPAWWLIDLQAVILGVGVVSLFGVSLGILPIVVLLVLLAVYDAISVYGTKHMLTLAEDAVSTRLPVLFVVPLAGERNSGESADPEGAGALYIGLGDAAIPGMLIVSSAVHLPLDTWTIAGMAFNPATAGAIVGLTAGLGVLLGMIRAGRAHAGLPVLNSGVILGFLIGAFIAGLGPIEALGL